MNYTHNNGMIIKYIDTYNNGCIEEQETSIASVILQSVLYCNYIIVNGIQYYVVKTKYIVSKDDNDKNIYEVYIKRVITEGVE